MKYIPKYISIYLELYLAFSIPGEHFRLYMSFRLVVQN